MLVAAQMSKRDYISEILEVRTRLGNTSNLWSHFNRRYAAVLDAAAFLRKAKPPKSANELTKYIPIGSVACLEQYFRRWAARLINSGRPFINRINRFPAITFNHASIIALNDKTISLGEFLSHQLPLSTLDDVNVQFSKLLYEQDANTSFLEELKRTSVTAENLKWDCDVRTIKEVKELYRYRHIFCHEVALKEKLTLEHAISFHMAGLSLSLVFDEVCSRALEKASTKKASKKP